MTEYTGRPWRLQLSAAGPARAGSVTTEDVRRAYFGRPNVAPSMWITEVQLDPPQLIVADDATSKVYRVPVTINGSEITFGDPLEVSVEYQDVAATRATGRVVAFASAAASRAGVVTRKGDHMTRTPDQIIAAAVARGAIPEHRGAHYAGLAAGGQDISYLDRAWSPRAPAAAAAAARPGSAAFAAMGGDSSPLLASYRKSHPALVSAAMNESTPPTLFARGGLPLATASGLDPSLLASVPWMARHPIAAEPSLARAAAMLEDYASDDGAIAQTECGNHPGNLDYANRMRAWLAGPPLSGLPDYIGHADFSGESTAAAAANAAANTAEANALYDALFPSD